MLKYCHDSCISSYAFSYQFRCQIPQGVFVLFPPKQSAPTCHSVPSLLVKVVLCFHKSYTRAPPLPWVIFVKSHKQIHHYLRPHLSQHYLQRYHASLMKEGFGEKSALSPSGPRTGNDSAMYLLTLNQCFTRLLDSVERGNDCSHILHATKTKQNQTPNKKKVEGIQSYSTCSFFKVFPPFQGKLPLSYPLLQPLPKHA